MRGGESLLAMAERLWPAQDHKRSSCLMAGLPEGLVSCSHAQPGAARCWAGTLTYLPEVVVRPDCTSLDQSVAHSARSVGVRTPSPRKGLVTDGGGPHPATNCA